VSSSHKGRGPVEVRIEGLESRAYFVAGGLDPSFGPDHSGKVLQELRGDARDFGQAIAVQKDGKIVVAGITRAGVESENGVAVARYNADGTLDTTFGAAHDGRTVLKFAAVGPDPAPMGLEVLPDGRIVLGQALGGNFAVFRLKPDGTPDPTFGDGAGFAETQVGASAELRDLVVRPDGRILAAGEVYSSAATGQDMAFVQFNADGSLDRSFGPGPGGIQVILKTYDSGIDALHLLGDGSVLAAGRSRGDFSLVRLDSHGFLVRSFGDHGEVRTDFGGSGTDRAAGIAVLGDGRIVLAGNSRGDFALARYSASGQLDTAFGTGGRATFDLGGADYASDLALGRDGKLIAVGQTQKSAADTRDRVFAAARFDASGKLDATFGPGGKVRVDFTPGADDAVAAAVQADGRILLAGVANPGLDADFALARLTTAGAVDATFGPAKDGKVLTGFTAASTVTVSDAVRLPDGKLLTAGFYPHPTLAAVAHVTRFNVDGTPDATFGVGGTVYVSLPGGASSPKLALLPDGRFVLVDTVVTGIIGGKSLLVVTRRNADGSADTTFGADHSGLVSIEQPYGQADVALDAAGGLIVTTGPTIRRLRTDGTLDTAFGTGGSTTLTTPTAGVQIWADRLAVDPQGRIVIAGHTAKAGDAAFVSQVVVLRLTAAGKYDATFGAGGADGDGRVTVSLGTNTRRSELPSALAVQGDGAILVGGTRHSSVNDDVVIVRLDPAGAPDPSFTEAQIDVGGDEALQDLQVTPDGKVLALLTTRSVLPDSTAEALVARLWGDGSYDQTFGDFGIVHTGLRATYRLPTGLVVEPDGDAVLLGQGDETEIVLARYLGGGLSAPRPRLTFADGTLTITGTPGDDVVHLTRVGDGHLLFPGVDGGTTRAFVAHDVRRIVMNGLGGDDLLDVSALGQGDHFLTFPLPIPVTLDGGAGNDTLIGGFGNDVLHGGTGDDALDGREGNDTLFGHFGADTLHGGDGNDYLNGGPDADQVFGDAGNDQVFAVDSARDTIDGGVGFDRVKSDNDDLLSNAEGLLA
jgi:uncharacterized delta-60 repeat protein